MAAVSVVIPTYLHAHTVLQALGSVFSQTFRDYEVIIVNDGSPDNTGEVLCSLVESGRVRYVQQTNAGAAAARNRGIAEAKGEFIALLDDDDLWPPDKLAWQVQALREAPDAVMVYGFERRWDPVAMPEGLPASELLVTPRDCPSGDVYRAFLRNCHICSPGLTLIRASALRAVGGFDPGIWGGDDFDLYIKLAAHGPVLYGPRPALIYREHAGAASANLMRHFRNLEAVRIRHLGRLPRRATWREWLACYRWTHGCWSRMAVEACARRAAAGAGTDAVRLWAFGMRLRPDRLVRPGSWALLRRAITARGHEPSCRG